MITFPFFQKSQNDVSDDFSSCLGGMDMLRMLRYGQRTCWKGHGPFEPIISHAGNYSSCLENAIMCNLRSRMERILIACFELRQRCFIMRFLQCTGWLAGRTFLVFTSINLQRTENPDDKQPHRGEHAAVTVCIPLFESARGFQSTDVSDKL